MGMNEVRTGQVGGAARDDDGDGMLTAPCLMRRRGRRRGGAFDGPWMMDG